MKQLETLSLTQMQTLLKELRMYSDMSKKLGRRGRDLFEKTLSGEKSFVVEYFPSLGEDGAYEQAQSVYKKSFSQAPKQSDIIFIPKEDLKGGIKVYSDDMMVDLSFKKVETLMQK